MKKAQSMTILEMAFVILVLGIVFIPISIFTSTIAVSHKEVTARTSHEVGAGAILSGLLYHSVNDDTTIADLVRTNDHRLKKEVEDYMMTTQSRFFSYEFFVDDDRIAKSDFSVDDATEVIFPLLSDGEIVEVLLRFEP